jgi:hypothetical protein
LIGTVHPTGEKRMTTQNGTTMHPEGKWYREPWPWLLMAGPAAVVVAGAITTWIAVSGRDPMVADDYYKQGLAINRDLARERVAAVRGLKAEISVTEGRMRVHLGGANAPEVIFVRLAHATLGDLDRRLRLVRVAPGRYEGEPGRLPAGKWRYVIEDPRAEWRLSGDWRSAP